MNPSKQATPTKDKRGPQLATGELVTFIFLADIHPERLSTNVCATLNQSMFDPGGGMYKICTACVHRRRVVSAQWLHSGIWHRGVKEIPGKMVISRVLCLLRRAIRLTQNWGYPDQISVSA